MSKLGRLVAVGLMVASFGIWVYAFGGFVERSTPDLWDDAELAERAEAICGRAAGEIAAMPDALEATSGADRANQLRDSTDRLDKMVDELATLDPTSTNDQTMHAAWIDDWRTVLADRYRYADAIEADPDAQYLQTDIGPERLDRRLTRFADANKMYACGAPDDV